MHPDVSREAFEIESKRVLENHDLVLDRGLLVVVCSYPYFTVAAIHRPTGKIRVFRFKFDDWNDMPPALSLVDAETGQELPGTLWPTDSLGHWHPKGWISEAGIETSIPFMCMAGIREYHTHRSHIGDKWENYKTQAGFDLPGIVLKVTEVFQKSNV
jgi:Predicted metal binding domain